MTTTVKQAHHSRGALITVCILTAMAWLTTLSWTAGFIYMKNANDDDDAVKDRRELTVLIYWTIGLQIVCCILSTIMCIAWAHHQADGDIWSLALIITQISGALMPLLGILAAFEPKMNAVNTSTRRIMLVLVGIGSVLPLVLSPIVLTSVEPPEISNADLLVMMSS